MPTGADSILESVKKALGIGPELTAFDLDIVMHINTVFTTLHQLGVGEPGFTVEDKEATWDQFYNQTHNLHAIRTYVYMRVRIIFDPPVSAYGIQSLENACKELEWRLNHEVEMVIPNAPVTP